MHETSILLLILLVPPSFCVGGEFEFLQQAIKLHANDHEFWCYLEPHCKQGSSNSTWERGLCRHGANQSPISINSRLSVSINDSQNLNFSLNVRHEYNIPEYRLEHLGHTVQIRLPQNLTILFRYPEKHLGVYKLHAIHFHWGNSNQEGSEHEIDDRSYAMEMHLVHFRYQGPPSHPGYSGIQEAVLSGDRNALAVVAVLMHIDHDLDQPSFLEPISSTLKLVGHEGKKTFLKRHPFKLGNMLGKQKQVYVYDGSLTTPPCSEIVSWIICKHPVHVREAEVAVFRKMSMAVSAADKNLTEINETTNHRKVQRQNATNSMSKMGSKNHIHVRLLDLIN